MQEKMLVNLTLLAVEEELKRYNLTESDRQERSILKNQNSSRELLNYILNRTPNIYAVVTEETVKEKYRQISKSSQQKRQITKLIRGGIKKLIDRNNDCSPRVGLLIPGRR
ncbi:MAG: hypothetical protein ACFBSE_04740 [Prochloraceae cyanobacterium]